MAEFSGKRFHFALGARTYIMGILNVTPDSFSDGGAFFDPQTALAHALDMQAQGADLLDVGAESTAPGHRAVSSAEEIERLRGVLPQLCAQLEIPVSVDTRHAETAAWALTQGAAIINDVSGTLDPAMAQVVAQHGAGWIITHGADADLSGGGNPLPQVYAFFETMLRGIGAYAIAPQQICLDPGIGFGKSREGDLAVLRDLRMLHAGDHAMLVGASRKRVIGMLGGEPDSRKRLPGTIACHTAAIAGGADFLRVHDVAESVQAARVADALYRCKTARHPGKILLRDLEIFAYHGVNPPEKVYGQSFFADVELSTDFASAAGSDDIGATVSYAQAAKTLRRVLTGTRYDLIETAAEAAAAAILREYPAVQKIRLRLKKPDAPMKAKCAFAAVEIERERTN